MRRRYTKLLTLEERTEAPDGGGGVVEEWTIIGTHWVDLKASSARERFTGGRQVSLVTHKAIIRSLPLASALYPKADQRFRDGERVYAIRGVAEADDRREHLICWLQEGALS
ncbi:MAG: head-tail adaptor protein [Pseudomonadota bacterium]